MMYALIVAFQDIQSRTLPTKPIDTPPSNEWADVSKKVLIIKRQAPTTT
ncbi:MAG: hypothetical protein ABJF11_10445 [Reichenbachiella sp.]